MASTFGKPVGKICEKRMSFEIKKGLFRSRNLVNLCIVAALWLLVAACAFNTRTENFPTNANAPANAPANQPKPAETKLNYDKTDKKEDSGDFIVDHARTIDARFTDLNEQIKKEKLLEKAADDLNKAFVLPNNVYLKSATCGKPNAEFDPETQTITVCFELMEHFAELYRSDGLKPDAADKKMFDAVRFAFLHEVGHALIHNYKLPVAGNEEDAADRCSLYINLEELGDSGVEAVLAASEAFRIEAKQTSSTRRDMSGEHLLKEQRYFNSLCMLYGLNSEKYGYFVREGFLPKERADRCPDEFRRMVESWTSLLEPWRKIN